MNHKGDAFFIKRGKHAIILVHGFTASTQEMEGLAKFLAGKNFTVIVPLLKGHNTNESDFAKTDSEDYYRSVLDAYAKVKGFESVDVIGLSFGATLALHLATEKKIRKIVALAPAIIYSSRILKFVGLIKRFIRKVPKAKKKVPGTKIYSPWDLYKPEAIKRRRAYDFVLLEQLHDSTLFVKKVKNELGKIKNPILIMHSKKDSTTKPEGSELLFKKVFSKQKKLIFLEKSGHIITEDFEADRVKRETLRFLK
jgi:carboxylesterase